MAPPETKASAIAAVIDDLSRPFSALPGKATRMFSMMCGDGPRIRKLCADIALLPEGRDLLRFGRRQGVAVFLRDDAALNGSIGETKNPEHAFQSAVVTLNRSYPDTQLVITLVHELRHAQQAHLLKKNGVFHWSLREETFYDRLIETDAYTFQTIFALKLKQAGRPEFLAQMNDAATDNIREFLAAHPPQTFKDEQALARGLFTYLALHPLDGYTADELDYIMGQAAAQPARQKPLPLDKIKGSGLDALYGSEFVASLSMRALKTGFLQTWSSWDRATIRAVEKMQATVAEATEDELSRREHFLLLRAVARKQTSAQGVKTMAGMRFDTYCGGGKHSRRARPKLLTQYAKKAFAACRPTRRKTAARRPRRNATSTPG